MKKEYKVQPKIIHNMIKYLDEVVTASTDGDKMKSYVAYLSERTILKPNRIKRILNQEVNKSLAIWECVEIARALGISMYMLLTFDEER